MKVVPTPLLEKKRAAAAEPPIPITRVKRETKVVANDLVKFELQVHPDDSDSTLKYTKTVHRLSADSTLEETLLWLQDLKSVIKNQRTTTAAGKADCHSISHSTRGSMASRGSAVSRDKC